MVRMPPQVQALTNHQLAWNTDFSGEVCDQSTNEDKRQ